MGSKNERICENSMSHTSNRLSLIDGLTEPSLLSEMVQTRHVGPEMVQPIVIRRLVILSVHNMSGVQMYTDILVGSPLNA